MSRPFLSLFTPTHRPPLLAQCVASVQAQTIAADIQHLIVPDYGRRGIVAALYGGVRQYAPALIGEYVQVLGDDDVLADPQTAAAIRAFAVAQDSPDVLIVRVRKGALEYPRCDPAQSPVHAKVDMASYLLRQPVFQRHAGDYGARYAGDFDHAAAVWAAGHRHAFFDRLCVIGGTTRGRGDAAHEPARLVPC